MENDIYEDDELRKAQRALIKIRDLYVPALLRDSLEADKVNCHANSIWGVCVREVPEWIFPKGLEW